MLRSETHGAVTRIDLCAEHAAAAGRWSACHLVDGILFDASMHHGRDELAGFVGDRVTIVALTHAHEDHCGGASAFADRARVLAPEGHLGLLAGPEVLPPPREFVWGRPDPVVGAPLPDEVVEAGRLYEVMPTPGHCAEHVSFLHRDEGWLFGGDIVTATRPRFARAEEDLRALMATLRWVRSLEPERLFLAHMPVPERATAPVEELLRYLEDRAAEIRGLADRGMRIEEIVEQAFGGEIVWWRDAEGRPLSARDVTGGDFSTENLVRKLLELT